MKNPFPESFVWGSATASYQVEGAVAEDGRSPSVWDTFSHLPGRIVDDHTGDVACDHFHRYQDDVKLMKWLGLKAYRFSVSWSRVFPNGDGAPNPAGLDFYNRLIDELLSSGIEPWLTCFHWDLPQSLEDRFGGWRSRDVAHAFADYAGYLSHHLSDRVTHYFTVNEMWNFTDAGYGWGVKAPGLKLPHRDVLLTRHHALLAHGLGVRAIRAAARQPVQIGYADALHTPIPVVETEANIRAAAAVVRDSMFLRPVMEGAYAPDYIESAAKQGVTFSDEDMAVIGTPVDFLGINTYCPSYVRASDTERGYEMVPVLAAHPRMNIEWLTVDPQVLYWAPRLLKEVWNVKNVIISENGCAAADKLTESGEVLDTDRVMYLRNHLLAARRAVEEGYPLKGYFLWSLLDNFEWSEGCAKRFGIIYVNFQTQARTPKLSAQWYRQWIAEHTGTGPD